jgi:hypothetical protein
MPHYLPSSGFIDERVISNFYNVMAAEARKQRISEGVFPVVGDWTLSDYVAELRKGTSVGLTLYRMAVKYTNFCFVEYSEEGKSEPDKGIGVVQYVSHDAIDRRVLHAWRDWMRDIATDMMERKIHEATIQKLAQEQPDNGYSWKRAYELTHKRSEDTITDAEKRELKALEETLDGADYQRIRAAIKPVLLRELTADVARRTKVPDTNCTFEQAFAEIDKGSDQGLRLYRRLVQMHDGFRFKDA